MSRQLSGPYLSKKLCRVRNAAGNQWPAFPKNALCPIVNSSKDDLMGGLLGISHLWNVHLKMLAGLSAQIEGQ